MKLVTILIIITVVGVDVKSDPVSVVTGAIKVFSQINDYFKEDAIQPILAAIISDINKVEKLQKENRFKIYDDINNMILRHTQLDKLRIASRRINDLYDTFQTIVANDTFENSTVLDFADNAINYGSNHLMDFINDIYHLSVPTVNNIENLNSIFTLLLQKPQEIKVNECNTGISDQQKVLYYYFDISMLLLKGFSMRLCSYEIKRKLTPAQYNTEISYTKRLYQDYMRNVYISAITSLGQENKYIRRCDPPENSTEFIELYNLFQGRVIFQYQLGAKAITRDGIPVLWQCHELASFTYQSSPDEKENEVEQMIQCDGIFYNCGNLRGLALTHRGTACKTSNKRFKVMDGFKLYEAYGLKKIASYGNTTDCQEESFSTTIAFSYDFCYCTCDAINSGDTLRQFSANVVESDIENNMVVTGVRFIRVNKAIYIQIQQGKVGPNITIIPGTVSWKQVDEMPQNYYTLDKKNNEIFLGDYETFKNDYTKTDVITSIQFMKQNQRIYLKVIFSKLTFSSGAIQGEYYPQYSTYQKNLEGTKISLGDNLISPREIKEESTINMEKDKWISFIITSKDKDLGQHSIPYIDSQPVVTHPHSPITGLGLYYKGGKNNGGYLGLKIAPFDYSIFNEPQF